MSVLDEKVKGHRNASSASFRATDFNLAIAAPVGIENALAFVYKREESERRGLRLGLITVAAAVLGLGAGLKTGTAVLVISAGAFLLLGPWVISPIALIIRALQETRALLDLSIDRRHLRSLRRLREKAAVWPRRRYWYNPFRPSIDDVVVEARQILEGDNAPLPILAASRGPSKDQPDE